MSRWRTAAVVLAVTVTLSPATPHAASGPEPRHAWLSNVFAFTDGDLQHLSNGGVIARTLDATDGREVALLGAVRIAVSPEQYVARLRDVETFPRAPGVLEVGSFHNPATLDDVRSLTLTAKDVRRLRHCRVGDCDLRLARSAIERLPDDGATDDATAAMRRVLVGIVRAYRTSGALPTYLTDNGEVPVAREFQLLVESGRRVLPQFPTIERRLLGSPADRQAASDLIYWSKDKLGPNQVVSITELTIARPPEPSPAAYVCTSRQLYADYYFDSSLGVTVLLDDATSTGPATIVVYVNRSRVDAFHGLLGGILRHVVRSRARSALARYLRLLPQRIAGVALPH